MNPAILLPEAEAELWQAVAYYEDKAAGLGLDFQSEIERAVQIICEAPARWPLRRDGTRRYLAQRFPFLIVYALHNDSVWILAFAHCKRRPEYWATRQTPKP